MAIQVGSSPAGVRIPVFPSRPNRRRLVRSRPLPSRLPSRPIRRRHPSRHVRSPASRFRRLRVAPYRRAASRFHRLPARPAPAVLVRRVVPVADPVVTPVVPVAVPAVATPAAQVAVPVAAQVAAPVVPAAVVPAASADHLVAASGVVVAIATSCSPRSSRTPLPTRRCQRARSLSSAVCRPKSSARS